MTEHPVNNLNNFIAGWIPDDVSICDRLIDYFNNSPNKRPGIVGDGLKKTVKDSTDCFLEDPSLYQEYNDYLQKITNLYIEKYPYCNMYAPWRVLENIQIQHYTPGGGYPGLHCERSKGLAWSMFRHLVFMTYLNDVSDQGETEWIQQQLKIKPIKGLTVIWPAEWTFTHRGVISATEHKYIITGWFSFLPENAV